MREYSLGGHPGVWRFSDVVIPGLAPARALLGVVLWPPQLEAEVAVRRPLRHRLGARQLHRRVEALDQREVAVAREQRADLRDAERAVHLRVPAARDVERELLLALLQHVHAVGVALLPVLQRGGEVAEAVAAHALGQL